MEPCERVAQCCTLMAKRGVASELESILNSKEVKATDHLCRQLLATDHLCYRGYAALSSELKGWLTTFYKGQTALRAAALEQAAREAEAAAGPAGTDALTTPAWQLLLRVTRVMLDARRFGVLSGSTAGGAIERGPSAEAALCAAEEAQERIRAMACNAQAAEAEHATRAGASAKDLQDALARLNMQQWAAQLLRGEGYAAASAEMQSALKRLVVAQFQLRAADYAAAAEEAEAAAAQAGADALTTPEFILLQRVLDCALKLEQDDLLRGPTAGGHIERSPDGFLMPELIHAEAVRLRLGGSPRGGGLSLSRMDELERKNACWKSLLEPGASFSAAQQQPDAPWAAGVELLDLSSMRTELIREHRGMTYADGIGGVEMRCRQGDSVQPRAEFEAGCENLERRLRICGPKSHGGRAQKFSKSNANANARASLQVASYALSSSATCAQTPPIPTLSLSRWPSRRPDRTSVRCSSRRTATSTRRSGRCPP